jgi:Spy/CpxP family protein refolding chaperone
MKRTVMAWIVSSVILMAPLSAMAAPASHETFPLLSSLELTQQQEDQLTQLRSQVRGQIETVVTPKQIEQFKGALQEKKGLRTAISAMNLSTEQRSQLRSIFRNTRTEFAKVLTPEQKQKMRQTILSLILGQAQ